MLVCIQGLHLKSTFRDKNAKTFQIADFDVQKNFGQQITRHPTFPPKLSKNFPGYLETFQCSESFKSVWELSKEPGNFSE